MCCTFTFTFTLLWVACTLPKLLTLNLNIRIFGTIILFMNIELNRIENIYEYLFVHLFIYSLGHLFIYL